MGKAVIKASLLIPLIFIYGLCQFMHAHAFIVYDPLNYFQNLVSANNSVSTLYNQALQIRNQIQAIQYEVKNSNNIGGYQWQNITSLINQMDQVSQQGHAVSVTAGNIDQQFSAAYPDYNKQSNKRNYKQAYQQWNNTTLDTLNSSMQSAGVSANHAKNESQLLDQLKQKGSSATGRMQVLQVSNQLALENVNQMQELKQLVGDQVSSQNTYMAYQVSKDSFDEQAMDDMDKELHIDFPQYKPNTKLALIPNMGVGN